MTFAIRYTESSQSHFILAVTGGNNLAGRIPSEIGNLVILQDLNIGKKYDFATKVLFLAFDAHQCINIIVI